MYTILLAFLDYRDKDVDVTTVLLCWQMGGPQSSETWFLGVAQRLSGRESDIDTMW